MARPLVPLLLLPLLVFFASVAAGGRRPREFWKRDHSDYSSPCNSALLYGATASSSTRAGATATSTGQGSWTNSDGAPVLLIPGIGGSSLWGQDVPDGPLDHVWATAQDSDCDGSSIPYKWKPSSRWRDECVIPEHLFSIYNATSGLAESVGGFNIVPAYDMYGLCGIADLAPDIPSEVTYMFLPLIQHLRSQGYTPGLNLFGFPYDWRQSNFESATLELLRDYVAYIHSNTGKKVVLVTHSMGGLKALSLLSRFPQDFSDNVQAWIAIACPFQGAPKTWNGFIQGYNMENDVGWKKGIAGLTGLSNSTGHQLIMQFPSVYELLPTPSFAWDSSPTLSFYAPNSPIPLKYTVTNVDSVLQNINGLNEVTYEFDGKHQTYLNGWQATLYERALDTKKKWSSLSYSGNQFVFVNIAASSANTPVSYSYTMQSRLLDTWGSAPTQVQWAQGDGTVPLESAFGDDAIRAILSSSNYHRHTITDATDHVQILQSLQTLQLLNNYLKK